MVFVLGHDKYTSKGYRSKVMVEQVLSPSGPKFFLTSAPVSVSHWQSIS